MNNVKFIHVFRFASEHGFKSRPGYLQCKFQILIKMNGIITKFRILLYSSYVKSFRNVEILEYCLAQKLLSDRR
jgi:hypothetical protein